MPAKTRSLRQKQLERATRLRREGRTWVEIAQHLGREYGLNPRAAMRLAHGWSQRDAADCWNQRWPDDPKAFKNFSYWEMWPRPTGYMPSLDVLTKLAELYQCAVADLLADCADFCALDHAQQAQRGLESIGAIVEGAIPMGDGVPTKKPGDLAEMYHRIDGIDIHELARASSRWAEPIRADVTRRSLLLKLSVALALAATMPTTGMHEVDEDRLLLGASGSGLSGIWQSTYTFFSSRRDCTIEAQHFLVLRYEDGHLVGQSLPHTTGSRLSLDLAVEKPIATGTWLEQTSPVGYYAGATYHGTLQMFIDPVGRSMNGKWLGFGRNFEINTGDWRLTWVEASISKQAQRRYDLRV